MGRLRITWTKSDIGCPEDQRGTIRALGFHKLNQTVEHDDTAPIRGMILKVRHLLKVEGNDAKAE